MKALVWSLMLLGCLGVWYGGLGVAMDAWGSVAVLKVVIGLFMALNAVVFGLGVWTSMKKEPHGNP